MKNENEIKTLSLYNAVIIFEPGDKKTITKFLQIQERAGKVWWKKELQLL
jgi:hypothetical protein